MYHDDMIELRPDEFRELIDDHFQMLYASGSEALTDAPIIARRFFASDADLAFDRKREIFAAVVARKIFRLQAPPGTPALPITRDEIDAMQTAGNTLDWLIGIHAGSLMMQGWDYRIHPWFFDHAAGIRASEHAPDDLREDPVLQAFPAKKLAGLDKDFYWNSVEEVVQWRERAIDLIRQGQETENEDWIRAGTEDLAAADQIYPTLAAPTNVVTLFRGTTSSGA
jgi:hypothetical protein